MGHDSDDDYDYEDEDAEPKSNLPAKHRPKIPQLFQDLGLGSVSTKDKFTMKYADGTLKVAVKRKDGVSQTVQRNVAAGFRSMTEFNPAEMVSKGQRNAEIRRRYKKGATQQELAELFGLSQAMISRIIAEC
jgi:hypothetical protein